MQVDPSVSFDQVGGLEHYIKALKEMVFLPLVYPELFERFHLSPPRGVLFYGPPGIPLISYAVCRAVLQPRFFMIYQIDYSRTPHRNGQGRLFWKYKPSCT